jgi:hypothetical protein
LLIAHVSGDVLDILVVEAIFASCVITSPIRVPGCHRDALHPLVAAMHLCASEKTCIRITSIPAWKSEKENDMPTETIIVTAFVVGTITILSLAIAYGQRQTTAYRREHPHR